MYLVENGIINYALNFEMVPIPKQKDFPTETFKCSLIFPSGAGVMDVMSTLVVTARHFHSIGLGIHKMCFNINYSITWLGIDDEHKKKLTNMNLDEIESFLGIDPEKVKEDTMQQLQNSPLGQIIAQIVPGMFED